MRKFEKISFKQFQKDVKNATKELYDSYDVPKRQTKASAGYDVITLEDVVLKPGDTYTFPTGIKCALNDDEVILLTIRCSMGFKYNLRLVNQVGIIDADFYNNPDNEGHLLVKIKNEGEKEVSYHVGDRIGECIIIKYLTVDDEEEVTKERKGGFGSTNENL